MDKQEELELLFNAIEDKERSFKEKSYMLDFFTLAENSEQDEQTIERIAKIFSNLNEIPIIMNDEIVVSECDNIDRMFADFGINPAYPGSSIIRSEVLLALINVHNSEKDLHPEVLKFLGNVERICELDDVGGNGDDIFIQKEIEGSVLSRTAHFCRFGYGDREKADKFIKIAESSKYALVRELVEPISSISSAMSDAMEKEKTTNTTRRRLQAINVAKGIKGLNL